MNDDRDPLEGALEELTADMKEPWDPTLHFGKYRGRALTQVPSDYLQWFIDKEKGGDPINASIGGIPAAKVAVAELARRKAGGAHGGDENVNIVDEAMQSKRKELEHKLAGLEAEWAGYKNCLFIQQPESKIETWIAQPVINFVVEDPVLLKKFLLRLERHLTITAWITSYMMEAQRLGEMTGSDGARTTILYQDYVWKILTVKEKPIAVRKLELIERWKDSDLLG